MNATRSDLKERLRASGTHPMSKTAAREYARRQGSLFNLCSPFITYLNYFPLSEASERGTPSPTRFSTRCQITKSTHGRFS